MRKILLFLILCCVFLAGCGLSEPSKTEEIKIGLVLNFGGPNDNARNQSAHQGLHRVAADFGSKVVTKMVETAADGNNEEYLVRLLAAEGYRLVFIFDSNLGERLPRIAAIYPNTRFVRLDSSYQSATGNLQEAAFAEQDAALVAGALAGIVSKFANVGYVDYSAGRLPSHYERSFLRGLRMVNKADSLANVDDKLLAGFQQKQLLSSTNETGGAKPVADTGVIFVNGMFDDQLKLINVCKNTPVKIITCGAQPLGRLTNDQSAVVLATVYKNTGTVLYDVVKLVLNGEFQGGVVQYGLNRCMVVELNDKAGVLTEQQKKMFDKLREDIAENKLKDVVQ